MTTVINTPGGRESSDNGVGVIVGVIVLLIVAGLFIIYVLPAIRGSRAATPNSNINVDVKLPSTGSPSPAPAQ